MSEQDQQTINLYLELRHRNQQEFYTRRKEEYEKAHNQAIILTMVLNMFALAASVLATSNVGGMEALWGVFAVVFPALATAFIAYDRLYAFENNASLYGKAADALAALKPDAEEIKSLKGNEYDQAFERYVRQVESVFQAEQGQWSLLTRMIPAPDQKD